MTLFSSVFNRQSKLYNVCIGLLDPHTFRQIRLHTINVILFNYCRNRPLEECCKYTGIYLPSPTEISTVTSALETSTGDEMETPLDPEDNASTSQEPQASASTHYESQQASCRSLDPERSNDSSDSEMDTHLQSDSNSTSHEAQGTQHQSASATNKTQQGSRRSSDQYLSESDDDSSDNTGKLNIMYSIVSKSVDTRGLGELQSCLIQLAIWHNVRKYAQLHFMSPPPQHTHTPFKFHVYTSDIKWVLIVQVAID